MPPIRQGTCAGEKRYVDGADTIYFRSNSEILPKVFMNPKNLRIGLGHDTHRLGDGGPLTLGGVAIDHDKHMIGHSDADVLLHAITDAVLGACGAGDIGELFPNTAEENRGKDSAIMLQAAVELSRRAGFEIVNLDCVVFAQRPKLSPHKTAMIQRVADILGIEPDQVGIKGKTGEHVGPVGNEQAIMAECVCLMYKVAVG